MPDINDAHKAGVKLADLKDAASLSPPVAVVDAARAVTIGLGKLAELQTAIDLAQDVPAQAQLLIDAGNDPEFRHGVAHAWMHKGAEVQARLAAIESTRGLKDRVKLLRNIVKMAAQELRESAHEPTIGGRPIGGLLSELGAEQLRAPPGYDLSRDGIWNVDTKICGAPVVVLRRANDLDLDKNMYEVAWLEPSGWVVRWVPGEALLSTREVVGLGKGTHLIGAPNAMEMIGYFQAFIDENKLPVLDSVSRMGWVGDSFVAGLRSIGDDVILSFRDPADLDLAKRVRPHGSLSGWCDVVRQVAQDVPLTMIYASLASPLLLPLRAPGFLVDLWCESRHGKTVALSLSASVWGPPDHESGPMLKWNSAGKTGLQQAAWFNQSLPLLLDETQIANPAVLASAAYELPDGTGSRRGKADGTTHKAKTWRLVVISTGERSANANDARQGAVNRALSINRAPFGVRSDANADRIRRLKDGLDYNYGTMGPRFIERVREIGAQELRTRHRELEASLTPKLGGNPSAASYVASLLLAGQIGHELGLPGDISSVETFLVETCRLSERDMASEAANAALEWATSNGYKFEGRGSSEPHGGWLGWWMYGELWKFIDFRPHALQTQLRRMGYDYHSVMSVWRARGWVQVNARGQPPKVDGIQVVRLSRDAMYHGLGDKQ